MKPRPPAHPRRSQNGLALLALLAVIGAIGLFFFVNGLSANQLRAGRDSVDLAALGQAKSALIAYATSVALTPTGARRPGDLPCPDTNNDGDKELSCGNAAGSTGQALRLGRLPWRSLGLPDLRDSAGERLWYAVSNSFKENTRRNPLNSDTTGTITVRDASGNVVFDGSLTTGVVAVIVAPGMPLAGQDRSVAGVNNASNYLEAAAGENNATFVDSGSDGFVMGPVRDAGQNIILNDRIVVITRDEIMAAIERRVAAEALNCLSEYAAANQGRYPWAAALNIAAPPDYLDTDGARFGRIPDTPFTRTVATSAAMTDDWTGTCSIASISGWWLNNNWKEMVFVAIADTSKPVGPLVPAPACSPATCLTVNPPSAAASVRVAVLVAGSQLGAQLRATNAQKGSVSNYLDQIENTNGDDVFSVLMRSATFNDSLAYR